MATVLHGYARLTAAVDIILDFEPKEAEKLTVFSLWDPHDPMREVDVFVEHPIPFDELWRDSELVDLGDESVRIASIPHLIHLKRLADRPEHYIDIEALTAILEAKGAR